MMQRREAIASLAGLAAGSCAATAAAAEELPAFWKSRLQDVEEAVARVIKGSARVLTRSAGNRPLHLVTYGEPVEKRSLANYNSACGGGDPASYARKDGTQPPVIFLLGPVHGGEFEGIVGLVNLLHVAETGVDLGGLAWKDLAANLARCRVLIVPSANPDGRARCPRNSWAGEELSTHEPVEMGTRRDGTSYKWPEVKRFHPMRPAFYRTLGAYFNDDGVNLMHDDWFAPQAEETRAILKLAREEAPDFLVSLHSHASNPSLEPTAYVPRTVKETIKDLANRVYGRYAAAGLPHRTAGPEPKEDGASFPPPSFNLASALHHACGGVSFVYETCNGVRTRPYPQATHDQLLSLQLLFYDELFRYALDRPVNWTLAER
jgi:hypothetical protein